MNTYTDALSGCIEALRNGASLEEALVRAPQKYQERLRADLETMQSLQRVASGVSEPEKKDSDSAAIRFRTELAELRAEKESKASAGFWTLPRVGAGAAAVVLVFVFGFFALNGDDYAAEAATLEGVVVESNPGAITLQTVHTLEQVTVPRGALISDGAGAAIDLDSIQPGQVVVIKGNRLAQGTVAAKSVDRVAAGLQTWCADHSYRCEQLELRLQETKQGCEGAASCLVAKEQLAPLLERLGELAVLEELAQKCRELPAQCQDLVRFCRAHAGICTGSGLQAPFSERPEETRERLWLLDERCRQGEVERCRQLGQTCGSFPALCSEDTPARP
jgi:hypothetical protein